MSKRIAIDVFKYAFVVVLLVALIWRNWGEPGSKGLGDIWHHNIVGPGPIHSGYLLIGLAFSSFGLLLTLYRWYLLVRAQDLPFTVPDALRIGLVGYFFNNFLPGAVGGDIIKAAFLAREQSRRTVAVATVIMDRIIALWALFWFVALCGGAFWLSGGLDGDTALASKGVVTVAGIVVGVSLLVWAVMGYLPAHRAERFAGRLERLPRVGTSAAEFWRAVWMYRCRQKTVYLVMLLSWIAQAGFVLSFYCAAKVVWDVQDDGPIPGVMEHFLLVPVGLVIRAAVPLPGGLGVGELGFGGLYKLFGSSEAAGLQTSLVQRVVEWTLSLCGLAVYLRLRTRLPSPSMAGEKGKAPATLLQKRTQEPISGVSAP